MSRRRRRVRGCCERWVGLPHWMLQSPAFRSLPGDAVKLLLAVWGRHNGVNNSQITYSCREAATEIGLTKNRASAMFEVLVERGFLVITRESSFDRKRLARCWRITAEPTKPDRSEKPTKDFMRWKPPTNGLAAEPHEGEKPTHSKLPITVEWAGLYGRKRPLQ